MSEKGKKYQPERAIHSQDYNHTLSEKDKTAKMNKRSEFKGTLDGE